MTDKIAHDQQSNIRHEGINVPRHTRPWDSESAHTIFTDALDKVKQSGIIPNNFGMLPEEWDNEGYPSFEIVKLGRRAGQLLHVALPDDVWRPRAVVWCQALDVLTCLKDMMDQ